MNIINRLTIRHLKGNRLRTILTIIGISVSVAMITTIIVGVSSYLDYQGRAVLYIGGDYHFTVSAPIEKLRDVLDNDDRVDSYGIEYSLDYNKFGYRLKGAKYKYNSIGSWVVGDKQYLSQLITCSYDGKLPESSNEMLVEQKYIDDNKLDWKIGDTVSLESGFRYVGSEYIKFPSGGQYSLQEGFDYSSTDSYKITGILHGNLPTKNVGTMLIRGADKNQEGGTRAYVKLKKVNPLSIIQINSILDKFNFSKKDRMSSSFNNSEYLQTKLAIDEDYGIMLRILPMCAAVFLLVIVASIVLIYNSFGMSLNEKIRYLGMLSSVGATRKQKRMSVIYEALVLSAVGIPIGILSGIGVIAITFALIGERIKASAIFGAMGSVSEVSLDIKVSIILIVAIILTGVLTVILSALLPSKRASEITAIEAIRQTEQIKIKHRIRVPFLVRKIFGYEGELAYKNMRRNGSKSRIITLSIALSLVLFLGCNYFCNLFIISTGLNDNLPYQLSVDFASGKDGEILDGFKAFAESDPDISKYYSIRYDILSKDYDVSDESKTLLDELLNENVLTDEYKELATTEDGITYYAIDDKDFNALCKKNGIDYKQFYDYEYGYSDYDEEVGYRFKKPIRVLLLNDYNHTVDSPKPFNENVIGTVQGYMFNGKSEEYIRMIYGANDDEELEITNEMIEFSMKSAEIDSYREMYQIYGLVDYEEDNYIFQLVRTNSIAAFYPVSVENSKFPKGEYDDGYGVDIGVETDSHARVYEKLSEYFESNEIDASVFDGEEWNEQSRTKILVLEVLIYGFIILISIITITNIVNTIASSVNNRKKEFAMLKSVGITPKGFGKMMRLESLFYAIEGVLIGVPISVIVCFIINKTVQGVTIPFSVDPIIYLASICVVFAVIGLTMLYASAKSRKSEIIEELKSEIN